MTGSELSEFWRLGDLVWLRPLWLLALGPVLGLAWLLWRRSGQLGGWERAVDPALMPVLRRLGHVVPGRVRSHWAMAALLILIAVALAGPARERKTLPAYRNLDAVMLVIDLSPSMTGSDGGAGRLIDTIALAQVLARSAGSRQVGVVVFAGDAYLALPLTDDARAVGGTLSLLAADTVTDPGSRPARGLRLAREVFAQSGIVAGDVVLISDGGGLAPGLAGTAGNEAAELQAAGYRLSAVHVPTASGESDATHLARLAAKGGGAVATIRDPGAVTGLLSGAAIDRLGATGYLLMVVSELGRWVLCLALIPAALLLPRRRAGRSEAVPPRKSPKQQGPHGGFGSSTSGQHASASFHRGQKAASSGSSGGGRASHPLNESPTGAPAPKPRELHRPDARMPEPIPSKPLTTAGRSAEPPRATSRPDEYQRYTARTPDPRIAEPQATNAGHLTNDMRERTLQPSDINAGEST